MPRRHFTRHRASIDDERAASFRRDTREMAPESRQDIDFATSRPEAMRGHHRLSDMSRALI